ncbi:hypothetical protein RGF97_07715 [Streptomyces roseicoloratus]|uniref:Uncharacterized protein n=1 Tax=Streptomyces roseicoloratus TaxID=2508722 RepID=A0ABY9RSQ8_9ACTN|nr:hypothetical protein [Streptomyces roseicoloratus]WMX44764.1 hypothetical protein RGF97_07715 [Streptomyces roseicoloratus]
MTTDVGIGIGIGADADAGAGADLSARWLADFGKVPEGERFDRLSTQAVGLTRIWLTSRNTGQVADSADSGRRSMDPS